MTELIDNKEEIDKIIREKIKGKRVVFTKHFTWRNAKRGISDEKVKEVFPQFDKVISIEKKKLKFGDWGYELFYSLSNNVTFSIALCPIDNRIDFIHAIEFKRNLGKRFRRIN